MIYAEYKKNFLFFQRRWVMSTLDARHAFVFLFSLFASEEFVSSKDY